MAKADKRTNANARSEQHLPISARARGMNERLTSQSACPSGSGQFIPLLLLFVGSGCAALIYEIVWLQMLQLVIGSSAFSMAVLLGTFMGGMCAGSLALPRFVSPRCHPLRAFAWLETGTGFCGLAVLILVPYVARLYVAVVGHGLPGFALRGVVSAACLLPPTLLMGATLPAISRWVETTPCGISRLGFLYGANILGAVLGCLLAGFYLLRVHDMATATGVAAGLNALVALTAFYLASRMPYRATESSTPPATSHISSLNPQTSAPSEAGEQSGKTGRPQREPLLVNTRATATPGRRMVYATIAISGLCALAAEVLWTRLLSLMLGATVYTFSIILAVFLMGLGIGSGIGAALARSIARPRMVLGCFQLLLAGAIALTAHLLMQSLPYWPINPSLSSSPWFDFQLDLLRCAWAILPATCLWGASFPIALAAAASPGQDPGQLVGRVYAANTLGAILGAIGCSLLLIPWLGSQQVQRLLIGFSGIAGLLMFVPLTRSSPTANPLAGIKAGFTIPGAVGLLIVSGGIALLALRVPELPWKLVAYGRYLPSRSNIGTNLYTGEGMNSSVAVTESAEGIRNFHVSGRVEASTDPPDMRLQRMLGHLPALLHPQPRSVLVVGCGSGITAGSFTTYPALASITICELEPLVPQKVAQYFSRENYSVLQDPRTKVIYDDARHFVLTSRDKFDIITSDPIHPWVKGAATLYTKEYLESCKRHLNPGGLVSQWVPLYESNLAAVKSELATFFEVFPNGTVWGNDFDGLGYDLVLLGQVEPLQIEASQVQGRLNRDDYQLVRKSLREARLRSAFALLATYAGHAPDLKTWLQGAEINRDRNLRLQYLAGLESNFYQQESIYAGMLRHRRFPGGLFIGSEGLLNSLHELIERPRPPQ